MLQRRTGRTLAGWHQLPEERGHAEPVVDSEMLQSHQLSHLISTDE